MQMARAHLWISGRVQGVCFRAHTRRQAQQLGLTGWVRNRADGRVEAVFEGERSALEKIIAWCQHGPALATVSQVKVEWEDFRAEFDSFHIRSC